MVFLAALAGLAEGRAQESWRAAGPEVLAMGREFLAVLETGQPAQLESYLASRTDLLGPEQLTEKALGQVYDGAGVRRFAPFRKSIVEIVALGDLAILDSVESDSTVILFFVPGRYLRDADRLEFYVDGWMRKYFACRFDKAGGRWQLSSHICYAGFEGPYPLDMA